MMFTHMVWFVEGYQLYETDKMFYALAGLCHKDIKEMMFLRVRVIGSIYSI